MAKINSRRKGKGGELELAHILSDFLGTEVRRRLHQSRDGGHDLDIGSKYAVEVKRTVKIGKVYQWLDQATTAAEKAGKVPVVAFRADGKSWVFAFRLHDALNLLRESL